MLLQNNTKTKGWRLLHVGGERGVKFEHVQVLVTNLLLKTLGVAREQESDGIARSTQAQNDVFGPSGCQDVLRRGAADCCCQATEGDGEEEGGGGGTGDLKGKASCEPCETEFREPPVCGWATQRPQGH